MNIKSILRQATALILSLSLYANGSFAMELDSEALALRASRRLNVDTSPEPVELDSKESSSSITSYLGLDMSAELSILNASFSALQKFQTEEFKTSLNNLLTWIVYNESKRLYAEHGDKFITPLADSLIDINFNIINHLILKTVGLKDTVKAVGILRGKEFSLPQKPSEYIRENYSQKIYDFCRLKFATDALNEKVVAPYLVAPSLAYGIHKADLAGLLQQHLFSQIQTFLEDQKIEMHERARKLLVNLESERLKFIAQAKELSDNLNTWAESEEALEIQRLIDDKILSLEKKQAEYNAQKIIVDKECKQMSYSEYFINFLPGTSTPDQLQAAQLQAELTQYQKEKSDLENQLKSIKTSLEDKVKLAKNNAEDIAANINNIQKGIEGKSKNSPALLFAGHFLKSFLNENYLFDEDERLTLKMEKQQQLNSLKRLMDTQGLNEGVKESDIYKELEEVADDFSKEIKNLDHFSYNFKISLLDDNEIITKARAGMSWGEMMKPCPYIEYSYLKWIGGGDAAVAQENDANNKILEIVTQSAKKVSDWYLECMGVTKDFSKLKNDISTETLTDKVNTITRLLEEYEVNASKMTQRTALLEQEEIKNLINTFYLNKKNYAVKLLKKPLPEPLKIFVQHAVCTCNDAISLGNSVRKAFRPIRVIVNTIKYYPYVWAIDYLGSFVIGECIPYGAVAGISLTLSVMAEFELWTPIIGKVTEVKNSMVFNKLAIG